MKEISSSKSIILEDNISKFDGLRSELNDRLQIEATLSHAT